MSDGRRSALVVANDTYSDPRLRRLRAPATDAEHLARVLRDAEIGGFDVEVSLNEAEHVVRRKLSAFFDDRGLDDLLLLHLSCHGVKDEDGRLYFATPDTEVDHLDATSVPADYVNRQMTRSRSRRIVLLLDCCYSGAFARGMLSRGDERVDIMERFDGRGRIVLTASSAMEYSFEGDQLAGEGRPSVFTSALVEGLTTGDADRNRDGYVSVDELYDFAYDRVRAVTPAQTPGKWVFDVQGDFYIARSRRPPEPVDPLADLRAALASPFANVRLGAVEELAGLLDDPDEDRTAAARAALDDLAEHDSERLVRNSARRAGRTPDETAEGGPAGPEPEARTVVVADPTPPGWVPVAGWAAAAALLAALVLPLLAGDPEGWNMFAVVSPIEVVAVAVALVLGSRAVRRRRLATASAAGLFLVVGVLMGTAGLGLVKFTAQRVGVWGVGLSLVTVVGAVIAVGAGAACWRSVSGQRDDDGAVESVWLVLALIGTGLAGVALFVYYDGFSSLWSEVVATESAEFFFEPATAVLCLVVGVLMLRSQRRFATATLITAGALTALHHLGVLIAAARAIGEVGEIGSAGMIGLVGGLLATFAGWQVHQSSRRT